ncbi:putative cinnamoyl-CoA reductase [Rosa chinensis]|uniref:Putative cinnamoyl-CoA reductase n=1 Tax=Rosa chinensis TaxID=74649 RepID=A0A2P6PA55_ROSCH|nr:cinnamoyl-CoA reductase-like SNL6 [Rosa chinensis]PRQ18806.1 putative cinnamoyl-CoA reductase [Rosa chinensis]
MAPAASNPFDDHHGTTSSTTVCVMDASGHLGSTLVQRLVQTGYTVHAALQSHGESKLGSVSCENNKRLKIFHLDPFDYQSIVDALKGCSGLFYTFEPPQDQPDYDEYMAEVEVRAAHNVLEACARTETIDKVVFTSSVTAVVWSSNNKSTVAAPPELDERHWTDVNFCRKFKLWHALSKTLAEKTAWALAMDRSLNMVSMNAGLMINPDLSISNPYLKGAAEMYEDGLLVTVDINFLVDAHICVFEDITAYGRYVCFNKFITQTGDAVDLARKLTPSAPASLPQSKDQDMRIIQERISNKKLNKLMVGFKSKSQMC